MLSRDGVIVRLILAFAFFFLSGTEILTGNLATLSGVMGTVELATALLRYSPLQELIDYVKAHPDNIIHSKGYHAALK